MDASLFVIFAAIGMVVIVLGLFGPIAALGFVLLVYWMLRADQRKTQKEEWARTMQQVARLKKEKGKSASISRPSEQTHSPLFERPGRIDHDESAASFDRPEISGGPLWCSSVQLEVAPDRARCIRPRRRRSPRPEHATSCASPPDPRTPFALIACTEHPHASLSGSSWMFGSPAGASGTGKATWPRAQLFLVAPSPLCLYADP
jgi:hypothetical protein